mgnify:CR=1 FL=1
MDLFWIKTLANSAYTNGRWQLDNPQEIKAHNKMAVIGTINEIYQDLILSVNSFNEHVNQDKHLRLLPIYCEKDHQMKGFVIMIKNLQIRLERSGAKMDAILESTKGFRQQRECLHSFEAKMDALGGLTWIMDSKAVMSHEMIVKQLLHDLCSTAFELVPRNRSR